MIQQPVPFPRVILRDSKCDTVSAILHAFELLHSISFVLATTILTEDFSLGRNTEKIEGVSVFDKLQQIDFKKFIVGTILEDLYEDFMSCSKNGKNSEV